MVHLFGDINGDFAVLVLVFILYSYLYIFVIKEKREKKKAAFFVGLFGFIVSGLSVVGAVVFGDYFIGQEVGYWISVGIFLVSLATVIVEGIDLRAEGK